MQVAWIILAVLFFIGAAVFVSPSVERKYGYFLPAFGFIFCLIGGIVSIALIFI